MKETTFPDGALLCSHNTLSVPVRGCSFVLLLLLQLHGSFLREKKDADDNKNTHARRVEIENSSPTVTH